MVSFARLDASAQRSLREALGLRRDQLPALAVVSAKRLRFALAPPGARFGPGAAKELLDGVLRGKLATAPLAVRGFPGVAGAQGWGRWPGAAFPPQAASGRRGRAAVAARPRPSCRAGWRRGGRAPAARGLARGAHQAGPGRAAPSRDQWVSA